MKIAVVGAGITGITAAYYLARDGHDVTVYDQEPYPAMRTSYANGGQLSVSNSETWNTWSNIAKGLGWMFRDDAPLLVRPDLDLRKYAWLMRFLWHTLDGTQAQNTRDTIALGLRARELYREIITAEQLWFDQSFCGILHFYRDQRYFDRAVAARGMYELSGCEWDIVDSHRVIEIEPALGQTSGIIGGAWTPSDWTGDIHRFCYDLAQILSQRYHVDFQFRTRVEDLRDLQIFFDAVIVSNGVNSVNLARSVGDILDIYPVKGYSITIDLDDASADAAPQVSLLDDQAKIVTARLGRRFRVAGTAELAGENYDIRRARIEPLLRWVHENFPDINTSQYRSWACLRPMTPNMMPIVRQSTREPKIFYNTGHGHLGWTTGAATARDIADMVKNLA
jgi:D-amino-acid dehydrogenase